MPVTPRVFISYAAPDEAAAARLRGDLESAGVEAFYAPKSIAPGHNFVLAISAALEHSDYFVLLLSHAAIGRGWVEVEWTSALAKEINQNKSFLFILRLDDSSPPRILSARNYLDAARDWDGAVQALLDVWKRDSTLDDHIAAILPSPGLSSPSDAASERIGIYVFNQRLGYQYLVRVPARPAGRQVIASIKRDLELKDRVELLAGLVGLRLEYSLTLGGRPIMADDRPVELREDDCLDLTIAATYFGPEGDSQVALYRDGSEGEGRPPLDGRLLDRLSREALGHLLPLRR